MKYADLAAELEALGGVLGPLEGAGLELGEVRDGAEEPRTPAIITNNPRDGLATIVAYVRGEEFFYDANGSGRCRSTGSRRG